MFGRITYITTNANTPYSVDFAANKTSFADVFTSTLPVGHIQDIYLRWGYKTLDPTHTDKRTVSQSASGVVQITNFLTTQGYKFSLENIIQDRTLAVDEYSVIEALNYELTDGTVIQWYPDWDNHPTEYFSCIANKRLDQKRLHNQNLWQFDFDLMVVANVQVPSTVPSFVM